MGSEPTHQKCRRAQPGGPDGSVWSPVALSLKIKTNIPCLLRSSNKLYEVRERLWRDANEKLKTTEPDLYASFQDCLRSEARRIVALSASTRDGGDEKFLFDKAEHIILSRIRKRQPQAPSGAPAVTWAYINQTAQIVTAIKSSGKLQMVIVSLKPEFPQGCSHATSRELRHKDG